MAVDLLEGYKQDNKTSGIDLLDGYNESPKSANVDLLEGYQKTTNEPLKPQIIEKLPTIEEIDKSNQVLQGYVSNNNYIPDQERIQKNLEYADSLGLDKGKAIDNMTPLLIDAAILSKIPFAPALTKGKLSSIANPAIGGSIAGAGQTLLEKLSGRDSDLLLNILGGTTLGAATPFAVKGFQKGVINPLVDNSKHLYKGMIYGANKLDDVVTDTGAFIRDMPILRPLYNSMNKIDDSITKSMGNLKQNKVLNSILDYIVVDDGIKNRGIDIRKPVPVENMSPANQVLLDRSKRKQQFKQNKSPEILDFQEWAEQADITPKAQNTPVKDPKFNEIHQAYGEYLPPLEDMPIDELGRNQRGLVEFKNLTPDDVNNVQNFINLHTDISDIPTEIIKNGYQYDVDYETGKQIFKNSLNAKQFRKFRENNINPDKLYDYLHQSIIGRAEQYGRMPQNITKLDDVGRTKKLLDQYELERANAGSPLDLPENEAIELLKVLDKYPELNNSSMIKELKRKIGLE